MFGLAQRTLDFMGFSQSVVPRDSVVANSDYVGDGYGLPTDSMVEAVKMLAQFEGILLDPVYSGKGFRRSDRPGAQRAFQERRERGLPAHRWQRFAVCLSQNF